MKIVCLQENLKESLLTLERATSKNQTMPILHNILLKTEKGMVSAFATDLEIGIEKHISCKIEKQGEVMIPVKTLLQFIQNLPNTRVGIETKNNTLHIETEQNKIKIPITSVNEFPLVPKIQPTKTITLQKGLVLKKALQQVLNSIATSYSLPEITGVLWVVEPYTLKLVSTDSFRLSEKVIFQKDTYTASHPATFIIPQKTAAELVRDIDTDEPIDISLNEHQIVFTMKNTTIISRLITGEYPKYEQIIPTTSKTVVELEKGEFVSQIKLASVFSSKINDVKVCVKKNKKIMEITSQDQGKGEFYAAINLPSVTGEDVEVVFNYKYLLEGLANIGEEEVVYELNGPASPAVFKTKTGDYRHVVMPIKT